MHPRNPCSNTLPRRLDKFLKDELGWTRPVTHERLHEVRVNGQSLKPCDIVLPTDEVVIAGESLEIGSRDFKTYVFHKPTGIITAHSDPHGRACLDQYSQTWGHACAVGRLDKDTSGLLIITDDGDLTFALMYPEFEVRKRYIIGLPESLERDDSRVRKLLDGLDLQDGPARALSAELRPEGLAIEIDEGRNRQVRRMCKVAGLPLQTLHREAIGSFELDVEVEQFRELSEDETDELWADVGGRAAIRKRQWGALTERVKKWREQGRPDTRLEDWLEEFGDDRVF